MLHHSGNIFNWDSAVASPLCETSNSLSSLLEVFFKKRKKDLVFTHHSQNIYLVDN